MKCKKEVGEKKHFLSVCRLNIANIDNNRKKAPTTYTNNDQYSFMSIPSPPPPFSERRV